MTLVTETGFDRRDAAGWWLGMRVVRVGEELVVYSPTRTSDDVFERLDALGRVSVLVAPNHFHHHVCTPVRGLMGAVLRATATTPGLQCGRTFKYLAVSDARAYRRWAEETLRAIAPDRVLFSHGEALEGPDVLDRLLTALDQRFGAS